MSSPVRSSSATARLIRGIGSPASSSDADHAQRDEVTERVRAGGVGRRRGTTRPMRRHASTCAVLHPESRAAWIAV